MSGEEKERVRRTDKAGEGEKATVEVRLKGKDTAHQTAEFFLSEFRTDSIER